MDSLMLEFYSMRDRLRVMEAGLSVRWSALEHGLHVARNGGATHQFDAAIAELRVDIERMEQACAMLQRRLDLWEANACELWDWRDDESF
jgi:hypothetical protein